MKENRVMSGQTDAFVQHLQDEEREPGTIEKYLRDIQLKIYEVAANVGYTDSRYFSQLFRKKTGYTPGQYREFIQQK